MNNRIIKMCYSALLVFVIAVLLSLTAVSVGEYDNVTELTADSSIESFTGNGKSCHIYGKASDITLTFPSIFELTADLRLDNLTLSGASTIYANGHKLYIGSNVTSDSRLTVYGGARNMSVASTDIRLYGGMYNSVYAGGNGYSVTGDTNLIFGGNCNRGDGINDQDSTTMSPCNIYGGGNNGAVLGKTNIYFEDNAVSAYIFGAGTGANGTATDTNITISGGKVMNVYGGSSSTVLVNCNTHITMTGGMAESVFGASSQSSFTGNTYLTLLGGEVTRRVYTGCYNEWKALWQSTYYVNGATHLIISKDMLLNTKNGLATQNQNNIGVFCGSRCGKNGNTNEINTVLFLDGCYDSMNEQLGDKSGMGYVFYSHPTYTVDISSGGNISFTSLPGTLNCTPIFGKYMTVNGTYTKDASVSLTEGSVDVITFIDDFAVSSFNVTNDTNGTSTITIDVINNNISGITDPVIAVSLKDTDGHTVKIFCERLTKDSYSFTTDISFATADVFIMKSNLVPLCKKYTKNITNN